MAVIGPLPWGLGSWGRCHTEQCQLDPGDSGLPGRLHAALPHPFYRPLPSPNSAFATANWIWGCFVTPTQNRSLAKRISAWAAVDALRAAARRINSWVFPEREPSQEGVTRAGGHVQGFLPSLQTLSQLPRDPSCLPAAGPLAVWSLELVREKAVLALG